MKNRIGLLFIFFIIVYQSKSFAQTTEVFQVDFALWGSVYADWNKTDNVNPNTVAVVLPGPIQTLGGLDLPISISIESAFDGPNYGGMTSGIYPTNVMKRGYYVESRVGIIKLSGLELSKKYTITCFGSKSAYGNEDYTTIYTDVTNGAGGISSSLNAYQNTTNTVDLEDLVPNSSGEILLSVTKDANALSGYINAIVVTISDNISTPKSDLAIISSVINPTSLRPEDEIQIESTVQNIGAADADATNLRYYLSDDATLDGSDILLGESLIKDVATGLSQGEPITVQATVQIPAVATIGDKYIIQIVDQDNILDESDESNNENDQSISILEPPTIRYVAVDGSDETGDGSLSNPFLTIQYGIDQMNPDDILIIGKGTFAIDNSLVLKSNITIQGEDRVSTIINYGNDSGMPDGIAVFTGEDISNIVLFDFTIFAVSDGIVLNSSEYVNIQGLTFLCGGNGIVFNSVSNAELVNNTIRTGVMGGETGLKISNQSGYCIVKNNIISDYLYLVYFENLQTTPEISFNDVTGGMALYTGIADQTGISGNISVNPEYYDFYSANGLLRNTSPCINAGDPSILDPDGSISDIGANPHSPEIIYVSTVGSDITGDGSLTNPYGSIQYGIEVAILYDTVQVMAGNHKITQTLNLKSGIYLRGDDPFTTTIFRDYPYDQDLDFEIIKIDYAHDVTIEDLRITTFASENFIHTGIYLIGAENITISRCVLFNLYNGISANYGAKCNARNNTMVGQLIGPSGSAISATNGSQISIDDNILSYFNYGINFTSASYNSISYNDLYSNSTSNYNGLADQTGLNGNISVDPDYQDFYTGDGKLNPSSPCIDAGDPNSPFDPDGTRADIGAIPYNQSTVTLLELTSAQTNITCFGGNEGAIDLTVTGGQAPYNFSWSNGETTEDITDLVAGSYSVTVTDQAAQESTATIEILEPEELILILSQTGGSCTGTELSLVITVSGGTSPYAYELDADPSVDMAGNEETVPITEGNHTIILTDANGCTVSETIDISDIAALVPEICVITVDEASGNILVDWTAQAGIEEHNVYRESNKSDVFEYIGTASGGNSFLVDYEADPDIRNYRYKISALDLCGGETELSAPHKSMHLTVNVGLNDEVNLIWDTYEGFDYSSFNILRGPSEDNMTDLIATVPSTIFSYTDLNPDVLNSFYQIEVTSTTACGTASSGRTSGKPTSRSNAASKIGAVTALQDDLINQVEIYPNPADRYINIKFPPEYMDIANIELRDITGNLVQRKTDFSSDTYSLDVHQLSNGVYVLHMKLSSNYTMNRKIIVNR